MKFQKIFVTVGTTQFDELIKGLATPDIHRILKDQLGCKELTIQIGRGQKIDLSHFNGIHVDIFDLKPSITDHIEAADLIISHAGAGTCIDVLTRGKPLIVVVNETLMHNHQIELAEQLSNDGYLFYTTISQLPETLASFDISKLKKYEEGNAGKFVQYLDDMMGFI